MSTNKLDNLKSKLFILDKKRSKLLDKIHKEESKTCISCIGNPFLENGCNKIFAIKNLVYIRTHYYVPPRGCNEGDYWNLSNGMFICPACNIENKFIHTRKSLEEYRYRFKKIIDYYDYGCYSPLKIKEYEELLRNIKKYQGEINER